jgi:cytoskeletal protein RodZ
MTEIPATVGEYLRKTREARSISLEQVAQVTRVRLPYLIAIENDEPSGLPSAVQARGFLRLYASFLDIPAQPLLDGWKAGVFTPPNPLDYGAPTPSLGFEPVDFTPQPVSIPEPEAAEVVLPLPPNLVEYSEPDGSDESFLVDAVPSSQRRSDQIFQEIGAILRERRESLHLSIADIERFTRLRAYYVTALEESKIEDLPSLVQGRGMLSNYAEFLDLDSEGLMLKFADALQTRRLELASPPSGAAEKRASTPLTKNRGAKPPAWRRFLTLDLVLGGGLFLLLIVFVLWGAGRVINLQRQDVQPTLASISDILMTPNADLTTPTVDLTASVTPMVAVANTQAPAVVVENTAEATELVVPTLGSAPISVYIVASQRAWMRVTVDTTIAFEGRVVPGNAYPFTGRESIELLTGNGAALQVIYNENDLGTLGIMGEVVEIAFTRDGTVVPTAQPTVTPSPTIQPTATLQPTLPQITPSITPYVP